VRLLRYAYFSVTGQLWKSKNAGWALPVVEKTTRQDKLVHIAKEGSLPQVRSAAVRRITDPECLKEVAIKDSNNNVRFAAVDKLYTLSEDEDSLKFIIHILSEILKSGEHDYDYKKMSAERLQNIYKKHANNSIRKPIRMDNGIVIKAHSDHHSDDTHSDNTEQDCAFNVCGDEYHTDRPAHWDHSDTPVERFEV
jgi:translation elongation factor EF-G